MRDVAAEELKLAIEAKARELGFDRLGFAPADPPARAEFFRSWLAEGKAGTMTYLHRSAERRMDPRKVLPGARTIVSVAESHFTERLPEEMRGDPSRGLIASYAWGKDYHDVLLAKLMELSKFVEELAPGHVTKSYVDTGHILERDHGERTGLGFVGKNTLLISPRLGSTFFLGEILTTLELPPTPPVRMPACGSCTRCLEVCPTHAFAAAYVLDSTLCISYLTIEYRGIIPRYLRSKMSNHLFGCDDCQDCCPWCLRFSKVTSDPAYRAPLDRQAPRLTDLASLTDAQFRVRFNGTAILRTRHSGLMRNVAIALGNWGSEEALESLEKLLRLEDPLVRAHAAWAVAQCQSSRADLILRRVEEKEKNETVRTEILEGMSQRKKRTNGAPHE